jgi:hypothetical protein
MAQPMITSSMSAGGAIHSIAMKKVARMMNDADAPAISTMMRVTKTSITRTLRWYSSPTFCWMPLLQRLTELRHISTEE